MKTAKKVKKTGKQKFKTFLKTIIILLVIIALLCGMMAAVSAIGIKSNSNFIKTHQNVEYDEQLVPTLDDDGYYSFTTDREFKIMQLTDIHIGAGFLSIKKDTMALNAVAAMITAEKPDLVIVTGDIAYPIPFQAGTFNNKTSAQLFAELMEQLGVYWCLAFGNHDTESYSYFSREDISEVYESDEYPHCLYQRGPDDVDGCGNYVINVRNSEGGITQSLIMLDSNSYVKMPRPLSNIWNYDCIHTNQVEWYKQTIESLKNENNNVMPKSLAFFHMPLEEYRDAWYEYIDNGCKDTENVKYNEGKAGEVDLIVYNSDYNYGFFDAVLAGGSTKGIFCGHDHLNNFSVDYKGIKLTYGYSVDYLAYHGIMKYGLQRGCTMITVSPDGSFTCHHENYYQDKYSPKQEKENVSMEDYYSEQ